MSLASDLAPGAEADYRRLLCRCSLRPLEVAASSPEKAVITGFLNFFAILCAAEAGAPWSADTTNPGYVSLGGPVPARVPYHIAPNFPAAEQLGIFYSIAQMVRIGPANNGSTICLSGSAAMLGWVGHFGDLDFCEYLDDETPTDACEIIMRHFAMTGGSNLCIAARFGRLNWKLDSARPGVVPDEKELRTVIEELPAESKKGKMDFVASLGEDDAAEISNVLIWLNGENASEVAKASFSQQESPLTNEDAWMPRRLDEPAELGAYCNFLRGQIDKYLQSSPVKASKRALSLASLFHLGPAANALSTELKNSGLAGFEAARQRRDCARRVSALTGSRDHELSLKALAAAERLDPELDQKKLKQAQAKVRAAVRKIRTAVTNLVAAEVRRSEHKKL